MAKGTILTIRGSAIAGGSSSTIIYGESALGIKNNSNNVFQTSSNYIYGTLTVYYNGQRLSDSSDYVETNTDEFRLIYLKPFEIDNLIVDYVLL